MQEDPKTPINGDTNPPKVGNIVLLTDQGKQMPEYEEMQHHTCRLAEWTPGQPLAIVMFVNPWKSITRYVVPLNMMFHPVALQAITIETEDYKALKDAIAAHRNNALTDAQKEAMHLEKIRKEEEKAARERARAEREKAEALKSNTKPLMIEQKQLELQMMLERQKEEQWNAQLQVAKNKLATKDKEIERLKAQLAEIASGTPAASEPPAAGSSAPPAAGSSAPPAAGSSAQPAAGSSAPPAEIEQLKTQLEKLAALVTDHKPAARERAPGASGSKLNLTPAQMKERKRQNDAASRKRRQAKAKEAKDAQMPQMPAEAQSDKLPPKKEARSDNARGKEARSDRARGKEAMSDSESPMPGNNSGRRQPGNSAVPSTVGCLGVDGFWMGDYGGGVRVGRPVGAR